MAEISPSIKNVNNQTDIESVEKKQTQETAIVTPYRLMLGSEMAESKKYEPLARHLRRKEAFKTARVVDIGCGRQVSLAQFLFNSDLYTKWFIGVDKEALALPRMFYNQVWKPDLQGYSEFPQKFPKLPDKRKLPTVVALYDVLEYNTPLNTKRLLKTVANMIADDGAVFVHTTPWHREDDTSDYVQKIPYYATGALFEKMGFAVDGAWGTFLDVDKTRQRTMLIPSLPDECYDKTYEMYGGDGINWFFATLYPEHSRTVLWKLSRSRGQGHVYPPYQETIQNFGALSSHIHWRTYLED